MTVEELSELFYLRKEIELLKRNRKELERQRSRLPPAYGAAFDEVCSLLSRRIKICIGQEAALSAYIAGIKDTFTREIFTMRYEKCMTWESIARKYSDLWYCEDFFRTKCYRYMKRHKNDSKNTQKSQK